MKPDISDDDIVRWKATLESHIASGAKGIFALFRDEPFAEQVVLELEGEMIDGGKEQCDDFVASNGLHYRW